MVSTRFVSNEVLINPVTGFPVFSESVADRCIPDDLLDHAIIPDMPVARKVFMAVTAAYDANGIPDMPPAAEDIRHDVSAKPVNPNVVRLCKI